MLILLFWGGGLQLITFYVPYSVRLVVCAITSLNCSLANYNTASSRMPIMFRPCVVQLSRSPQQLTVS